MKVYCNTCILHFPHEFQKTLKPPCNYWGQSGMATLPTKLKRKVWNWLFSMPSDEIAVACGIGLWFEIGAAPIVEERKFENLIPGYTNLTEEQRQQAQKEWYKKKAEERAAQPKEQQPVIPKSKVIN